MRTKLDCGHEPTPNSSPVTGYATTRAGATLCYACCAERDRDAMARDGHITLYLTKDNTGRYQVGNWPGTLTLSVHTYSESKRGGGFGSSRTDAWFTGPDGRQWHAIRRGNMDLCQCRRLKGKAPRV